MQKKMLAIVFGFSFFLGFSSEAQIKDILKGAGKALDKSPTKFVENYFNKQPVTTSFDDAKTEIELMADFDPPEQYFLPLSSLERNEKGEYILEEGLYSDWNKSFCLKAGTHGPGTGNGYLYAPLEGPKAFLVQKLLENWQLRRPEIPQSDVQSLIWAIIARTDIDKMTPKYKLTLVALLDKDDIAQLTGNALKDKAMDAAYLKLRNEIPPAIAKVIDAERNLRSAYSRADATYDQLEGYAMLAGLAPAADDIRPVTSGRWSFHPAGYFVRYFPSGYQSTKVDVYVPRKIEMETDATGRIRQLADGNKIRIEFSYGTTAAGQDNISSSGLNSVKISFPVIGKDKTFPIAQGTNLNFVKNDFSVDQAGTSPKWTEFLRLFDPQNGTMTIKADALTKGKIFRLFSAVNAIKKVPENALAPEVRGFLGLMLHEASNYALYQTLMKNRDGAYLPDPDNSTMAISGPSINSESMMKDDAYMDMDRGNLNLPSTVAAPANRSRQRLGQSNGPLPKKKWYEDLPPCPCTYKEAQDSAAKRNSQWLDCGDASQEYHYGATHEVRWKPSKPGKPGQQCTYDKDGNLITSGIAAGSPDKVSPQGCGYSDALSWDILNVVDNAWNHYNKDVKPFSEIPCWKYLENWPANNANNCPKNPINDLQHMKKLVGNMNCVDLTNLLSSAAKSKNISQSLKDYLFNGKGNLSNQQISDLLKDWKSKDCPKSSACGSIDAAIKYMSLGNH